MTRIGIPDMRNGKGNGNRKGFKDDKINIVPKTIYI